MRGSICPAIFTHPGLFFQPRTVQMRWREAEEPLKCKPASFAAVDEVDNYAKKYLFSTSRLNLHHLSVIAWNYMPRSEAAVRQDPPNFGLEIKSIVLSTFLFQTRPPKCEIFHAMLCISLRLLLATPARYLQRCPSGHVLYLVTFL